MVYHLTRGMTGKPKQGIGTRTGMYKHGETSILQQIKHSWLCGQRWSKHQPFGDKGSNSHIFPKPVSFCFFLEIGLEWK